MNNSAVDVVVDGDGDVNVVDRVLGDRQLHSESTTSPSPFTSSTTSTDHDMTDTPSQAA
jgi:hypothetical protein